MAKAAGGIRIGSTALATETVVSPLVSSWWGQGIAHSFTHCMIKLEYIYIYIYTHTNTFIYTHNYICICVCIHIHTHTHIYIYIYIYIYIRTHILTKTLRRDRRKHTQKIYKRYISRLTLQIESAQPALFLIRIFSSWFLFARYILFHLFKQWNVKSRRDMTDWTYCIIDWKCLEELYKKEKKEKERMCY